MAHMMLPIRLVSLAAVMLACVAPLAAQPTVLPGQEATEMEGVGIVQKLDEIVPSDLAFTNSKGEPVTIADFMGGEQPFPNSTYRDMFREIKIPSGAASQLGLQVVLCLVNAWNHI